MAWQFRKNAKQCFAGALMTTSHAHVALTSTQSGPELIGRVSVVTGSQATVELNGRGSGDEQHPFVLSLVVPKVGRRNMPARNDAIDANR